MTATTHNGTTVSREPFPLVATIGLTLALVSAAAEIVAGPSYRFDLLDLGGAFMLLRWGAWTAVAAVLVSLVGVWFSRPSRSHRGLYRAAAGLIIGAIAFAVPWSYWEEAQTLPPIHDITTDTQNPPAFVAILPLRADAPNSAQYGGPEVAQMQKSAYPDIVPLHLDIPAKDAFDRAMATARDMGWTIIDSDPGGGRIEATATTPWWGFTDDVVIRIRPEDSGSRVDIRSESRVGRSDFGVNAERVRTFLSKMKNSS